MYTFYSHRMFMFLYVSYNRLWLFLFTKRTDWFLCYLRGTDRISKFFRFHLSLPNFKIIFRGQVQLSVLQCCQTSLHVRDSSRTIRFTYRETCRKRAGTLTSWTGWWEKTFQHLLTPALLLCTLSEPGCWCWILWRKPKMLWHWSWPSQDMNCRPRAQLLRLRPSDVPCCNEVSDSVLSVNAELSFEAFKF